MKRKDCSYCKNAFTDRNLTPKSDFSYLSVGWASDMYSAHISASALRSPPVSIVINHWNDDDNTNPDVVHITPKYCPMCGRLIVENLPYLQEERGNAMTKSEWINLLLEIQHDLEPTKDGKYTLEDICEVLAKRGYGLERPIDEKTQ